VTNEERSGRMFALNSAKGEGGRGREREGEGGRGRGREREREREACLPIETEVWICYMIT
jgi:hypothetical protein